MNDILFLTAAAGLIVMSGYFSGSETGIYVMNVIKARLCRERGLRTARTLCGLIERPSLLLSTILIGTNLSNYWATALATLALKGMLVIEHNFLLALVTTLIMEPPILIFGEMLPKNLYRRRADTLMNQSARSLRFFWVLFLPVSVILSLISGFAGFLLGRRRTPREEFWTARNIQQNLTEIAEHGTISPTQNLIAKNVLELRHTTVRSVTTPLARVFMVRDDYTFGRCFRLARKSRYSRYPVYRGKRSNIIGVVNLFDPLFTVTRKPEEMRDIKVSAHVKPLVELADTMPVHEAIAMMRSEQSPLALVRDSKNRALGVVTLKDLVEEIVGKLPAW